MSPRNSDVAAVPVQLDDLDRDGKTKPAIDHGASVAQHEAASNATPTAAPSVSERVYIKGWRLYILMFGLLLAMFLSALETTIVSTSLVSITNALDGFDRRNWVVTSYLLTYTGFLVIYAKFSDVLGRKITVLTATATFTIASIACGFASTMDQLITLRAFQGLGASGIYAMVSVINPELVETKHWGSVIAAVSMTFVLSSSIGPIVGGLISENTTWRWVFLLNAPAGALGFLIIYLFLPANFPDHGTDAPVTSIRHRFSWESLKRLDLVGAALLIAASILVVFGFEEAGPRHAWDSLVVLSTLIVGALLFVAFILFERRVDRPEHPQEPVFPLRLLKSKGFVGLVIIGFCSGPPFWAALVNIPQRLQTVNGFSPLQAGTYLLPMVLSAPVATAVTGQLATRFFVPPFFLMLIGSVLLTIGTGMLSSIAPDDINKLLGFEAVLGCGLGTAMCTLLLYIPFVIERKDMAVTVGVFTQVRVLGGTIGLAISAAVMNGQISTALRRHLPEEEVATVLSLIGAANDLPDHTRELVRQVFSDAFSVQFKVMLSFCGVLVLAVGLLWEWPFRTAREVEQF
ncbi:drug resistance transporter EmrB/QacA subfamily [Plectosphaerella plurivora]|uniref:Drug resistance transporter EmrB/QacA subfamily n=1 Tax=Plectosphaerella plurivora TaxID=936078 RepID=A0A9P8VBW1_9PEZI|nr:drug resistance transporter EmrB/QacA subfamily [Plectosphaerella plurivora]